MFVEVVTTTVLVFVTASNEIEPQTELLYNFRKFFSMSFLINALFKNLIVIIDFDRKRAAGSF